jgi:tripartite ATP-independent transporter DctM subunit
MDPIGILIFTFVLMFILIALGVKIGIALAIPGVIGYYLYLGRGGLAPMVPFTTTNNFVMTAIPMFIFMGEVLVKCGASDMIYRGVSRFLNWAPGGLLHTNIGACALFASISGSSPATAATIGTVAIPEMTRRNYDEKLILGSLAAGGTLGILIPPSINMIIYGAITESSVGQLFAGGILPGITLSLLFMVYIAIRIAKNRNLAPREEFHLSAKSIALAFVDLWPLFALAVIVLGGIFGGLLTPTEAAAAGSIGSLIIAVILRRFNWQLLRKSLRSAVETTSMILFIVVGASILASIFARSGVPGMVIGWAVGSGLSQWWILIFIYILYVFLGCFIDPLSILILTATSVIPIIKGFGLDVIWFGVIYVVLAETGMITPPMGVNLFVIQGISRKDISKVIAGSYPFFLIQVLGLVIFTAFPAVVLLLPELIYRG